MHCLNSLNMRGIPNSIGHFPAGWFVIIADEVGLNKITMHDLDMSHITCGLDSLTWHRKACSDGWMGTCWVMTSGGYHQMNQMAKRPKTVSRWLLVKQTADLLMDLATSGKSRKWCALIRVGIWKYLDCFHHWSKLNCSLHLTILPLILRGREIKSSGDFGSPTFFWHIPFRWHGDGNDLEYDKWPNIKALIHVEVIFTSFSVPHCTSVADGCEYNEQGKFNMANNNRKL